jgi:hypothetical protein
MDETHDAYTDGLLARLRRYEFFGFKEGCDMLLRLEKTKEFLNAQNSSIARAEAWACVGDMKDLVIPIGKTLFDAAAKIESLRAEVAALKPEVERRTAERDAARREACFAEAQYEYERGDGLYGAGVREMLMRDAVRFAADRGWDCFDAQEVKP